MPALLLARGLEPCLFQDAIQSTWREVVIARAGNRDQSGLDRMFELLVAAARANKYPPVFSEPSQSRPALSRGTSRSLGLHRPRRRSTRRTASFNLDLANATIILLQHNVELQLQRLPIDATVPEGCKSRTETSLSTESRVREHRAPAWQVRRRHTNH